MSATVDPPAGAFARSPIRFAVGVAVPLLLVALSYALWWVSDRLLYIGPLDRAAFGWAVVIPLWVGAPVAAGFTWRRLGSRDAVVAAALVGAAISATAAVLFWQSVAYPACDFGAVRSPGDLVFPSLVLGGVIGGGLAVSALVASTFARHGRSWHAIVSGAGTEIVMVFAAALVAGLMLLGPGCQRPTI